MKIVSLAEIRDENDPIIALIHAPETSVQPSPEFLYWTRRMLINVMQATAVEENEAERAAS